VKQNGFGEMDRYILNEFYSSLFSAMFGLGLAMCGGVDWYELVTPLMHISTMYAVLYPMFISFTLFGILNVLVGIIVRASMDIHNVDQEYVIQETITRHESHLKKMKRLLHGLDDDQSGTLSWAELQKHLRDKNVRAYLEVLDLNATDALYLFRLLDAEASGQVTVDRFAMGCLRLKCQAKSIDVACVQYENRLMEDRMHERFKRLDKHIQTLRKDTSASTWPVQPPCPAAADLVAAH